MHTSCGILLYRFRRNRLQILLAHPGGQYNAVSFWGIPKGHVEKTDASKIDTALREFKEEIGIDLSSEKSNLLRLGDIQQNKKKTVYCFALLYDLGDNIVVNSNYVKVEYPRGSGIIVNVPEVDKAKYFYHDECRGLINPAQYTFIERLLEII